MQVSIYWYIKVQVFIGNRQRHKHKMWNKQKKNNMGWSINLLRVFLGVCFFSLDTPIIAFKGISLSYGISFALTSSTPMNKHNLQPGFRVPAAKSNPYFKLLGNLDSCLSQRLSYIVNTNCPIWSVNSACWFCFFGY